MGSLHTQLQDYFLEDYRTEIVNVKGTSFYPFLYLFNNINEGNRINKPITILTDDDRFTDSKKAEYSFAHLILDPALLTALDQEIQTGTQVARIRNLNSVKNNANHIKVIASFKTLEYEIAFNNTNSDRTKFRDNFLVKYLIQGHKDKIDEIEAYAQTFPGDNMTPEEARKIAILLWKTLPSKAEFAQDFSIYLLDNLSDAKHSFIVPTYITEGLDHLKQGL